METLRCYGQHLYNYCMKYQIKFVPNANFLRVDYVHLSLRGSGGARWGGDKTIFSHSYMFIDFEGCRIKSKCTAQTSSVDTAYT